MEDQEKFQRWKELMRKKLPDASDNVLEFIYHECPLLFMEGNEEKDNYLFIIERALSWKR